MSRNDQYVSNFKFILNIYTRLHSSKKQKIGLIFFTAGGVDIPLLFFMNCVTCKNYHGHNLQTVVSQKKFTCC
jgi:hypothetical protein